MERLRGVSYVPPRRKNPSIINSEESNVKRSKRINFSIGKSVTNIRNYEKILSVKKKCFLPKDKSLQKTPSSITKKSGRNDEQLQMNIDLFSNQEETEADNAEIQKQEHKGSYLLKSKFKGRPPTILFNYPKCCDIQELKVNQRIVKCPQIDLKYRIYGSNYRCIINAFQFNGFQFQEGRNWDVYFDVRGSKVQKIYSLMNQNQKFNHFAGCWHIGRKDELYRHIQKQRKIFPQQYNFLPKTFILPNDYQRFQTARQMAQSSQLWIQKPVASAHGRNIRVISNQSVIRKKHNTLISEYVSNPHLINKHKYDLRIYVLVTSYNPLKIYIFQNGLTRFATQPYTLKSLSKKFVHLTNFSVNKNSKNFVQNKSSHQNNSQVAISKWSLVKLKQHYTKIGIDYDEIFKQIQDIVIKTCIAVEGSMVAPKYRHEDKRNSGFQIYGFDILIDQKLKAWLIEVNVCPSLCSSSPLDKRIKHTLLVDILNLIGVRAPIQKKDAISPKKTQMKRFRFKNVHTIMNLSYQNCLQMLQPQDWLIIFESQEEMDRLGHFKRAFPTKSNIQKYRSFFECPRYNNYILWSHLLSNKSFLNKLYL